MSAIRRFIDYWYFLEKKFLPEELKGRDTLLTWKERALYLSFLCIVIFGIVALIPSLILAFQRDLMVIFVLDIITYTTVFIFLLSTKVSLKIKSYISLAVLYTLGITLLIFTGYYGAGLIWLFGASMFAVLFFDNRYTVFIIAANLLILLSIGGYIMFGFPGWHYLLENPVEIWIILTVNFMAVNALMLIVSARAKSNIDKAVERQVDAQASLMEEKEFSDYIIRSIPGLFYLFEQQKDRKLALKRWNSNFSTFFGYSNEELANMNSFQLFEKKDIPFVKRKRVQLFEKGTIEYEIDVQKKNGELVPVYVQMYGFQKNNLKYVIGTAVDISARRKEAKEKEQMQKSLAASQKASALGTLSSGIAHDFNNILSGIRGYAELIQMAPDDADNVGKGVEQILNGSNRARELVQQILAFSRQAKAEKRSIKPYLIVKEAVKFMRSSIPTSIEIKEKVESRKSIHADAGQLHQVVMNLCTNAYHAMRDSGGILTVELSEINIDSQYQLEGHNTVPGLYLLLKIADTGPGIDKNLLERIFEPYFTTKDSSEGTGLGLAVVQGIVKEHQGHISVKSQINQGTSFCVYFPVLEESVTSSNPYNTKRVPVISKKSENILVADDEPSIRVFMQSAFEDYGYHVETFPNGEEALERFKESPDYFDLLITDVAMPKMPGDRLVKAVLNIRPDLPIIVYTGYAETFDEETAYREGVKNYLLKPADVKDLLLAIQDVL